MIIKHHIMLLFLSTVRTTSDRKRISETAYENIGGDGKTKMTNESAVRYLAEQLKDSGEKLERLFVYASKMVRKPIGLLEAPDKTHLEYFFERMKGVLAGGHAESGQSMIEVAAFDEDNENIQYVLEQVVDMAEKIRNWRKGIEKPAGDSVEIVLHADCTGGFRYANMMMLALMRLLHYQKIEIGRILYSNYRQDGKSRVDDVTAVYDLFDLVAGAEEFVRFGSVKVLSDYYAKEGDASPELRVLISAMKNFSDQTKLCHYADLRQAIKDLREAVKKFDTAASTQVNDKLMGELKARIKSDYDLLLQESLDDISLIRWCLDHDLLQQALTFYTERVPEILCAEEGGLLYPTPEDKDRLYIEGSDGSSKAYNFLVNGQDEKFLEKSQWDAKLAKVIRDFFKLTKDHLSSLSQLVSKNDVIVPEDWETKKDRFFSQPNHAEFFLAREGICREMMKTIHRLGMDPKSLLTTEKDVWRDRLVNVCREIFVLKRGNTEETVVSWTRDYEGKKYGGERYKKLLDILGKDVKCEGRSKNEKQARQKFQGIFGEVRGSYAWQFFSLLDAGRAKSKIPRDELRHILNLYGEIKNERNHSNHAKEQDSQSDVESLKEKLRQGLLAIEQAIGKYADKEAMPWQAPEYEKCFNNDDKGRTFVNYTNHPAAKWSEQQKKAAQNYGEIIDQPFPDVDPSWEAPQIARLAEDETSKILNHNPRAVLCQGEFTLSYAVIKRLQKKKIPVLAACSRRETQEVVDEEGNTRQSVVFRFEKFREYGEERP